MDSEAPAEAAPSAPPPRTGKYPPYPPYDATPAPPSVAETVVAGHGIRATHKAVVRPQAHPLPKPARPRAPKVTDVKMSRRAMRAHARCLRRHGAVLTDRLERLSKPRRRHVIYLWREHADVLPPETIERFRSMLNADEPFKPDQAYEFFINCRKTKKKNAAHCSLMKKDMHAVVTDKRFVWARNATVAFARGIQQRLSRPGRFTLADGMLRLSNVIMAEICGYMKMRTPSRRCTNSKAKFMMEMSDKIAVWIDEILSESDDRMLMMDYDEDEDILNPDKWGGSGGGDDFADDFLNMMAESGLLRGPTPAYLKFQGEMLEAFNILTDSMEKKGGAPLLSYGKFHQTYAEGADELKKTPDFTATDFNTTISAQLVKDLAATAAPNTSPNIAPYMTEMVDICSNFLAQVAEYNKDKGRAFKLLIKEMKKKPKDELYKKEKINRTYGQAALILENAKGLETDHDDPNLSQDVHSKLSNLVQAVTPADLKNDMAETLDLTSKYLSQNAVDEVERGPAFDILIKKLEAEGSHDFTPQYEHVKYNYIAAYVLKSAPGLCSATPDPATAPIFATALHRAVDDVCPSNLKQDMEEVIGRCANYLSAFIRDREAALKIVISAMKKSPSKELAKRENYTMTYGTGATETETAPTLVPYLPIKDIADEMKGKLTTETETQTPVYLKVAVKSAVADVSKHLSQGTAVRSGAAGTRYTLNLLAEVMKVSGDRKLYKQDNFTENYRDGGQVLQYAGKLESDPNAENLKVEIDAELHKGIPTKLAPTLANDMGDTMAEASKHLAKAGLAKARAVERLIKVMKEEGDAPLGTLQGYEQTYNDGARRIINADSLANDKVDKGAYENVHTKLKAVVDKKPDPTTSKVMPAIVDQVAQFLAAPFPETEAEKRKVLADLMARKENAVLAQDGSYKITYTQGGKEIMHAPVGVTTAQDMAKKNVIEENINTVIPNKQLKDLLHTSAEEGAAYLADKVKGLGEAMKYIEEGLRKEGSKEFLHVGKFDKTYAGAADMLGNVTPGFGGENPNEMINDVVHGRLDGLDKGAASDLAKQHMGDAVDKASNYIAGVATRECGLDASALGAWSGSGGGMGASSAAGGRRTSGAAGGRRTSGAAGRSEDEEARRLRLAGQQGGEDEEARRRRLAGQLDGEAEDATRRRRLSGHLDGEAEDAARRRRLSGHLDGEDEEARRRRLAAAGAAEKRGKKKSGGDTDTDEAERRAALDILHRQLLAKGGETFYKQSHSELSHKSASEWLKNPSAVLQSVKESGDTSRLSKKFEKKLDALVKTVTPAQLEESMQDVVIESSHSLAEFFVAESYKALVKDGLISEMQKHGNDRLIEIGGKTETNFFAAQRLKKLKDQIPPAPQDVEPSKTVAHLCKKLEETIRCRAMPRKLIGTMKEHIKNTSYYLSDVVTTPDPNIEAYAALLKEMDAQGRALLIQGDIPKTYKDSAAYLRLLTSCEDQINLSNSGLESSTTSSLKGIMNNVPERGYTKTDLDSVISAQAKLLVSYIVLQGQRTAHLKQLVDRLASAPEGLLLRHGSIRQSNRDGARLLSGKNTDQLNVTGADPVVERKVQIKIDTLMEGLVPDNQKELMDGVILDATRYLAVHLLQPHVIQVCKCMKSVFVQCELWCDEIFRRMSRPCCSCSRQLVIDALADLAPGERLVCPPGTGRAVAPGIDITVRPCSRTCSRGRHSPCPASEPTEGCQATAAASYMLYSTEYYRQRNYDSPTKLARSSPLQQSTSLSCTTSEEVNRYPSLGSPGPQSVSIQNPNSYSILSPANGDSSRESVSTTMTYYTPCTDKSGAYTTAKEILPPHTSSSPVTLRTETAPVVTYSETARIQQSSYIPVVSTDQMGDWHAMMVSLIWNVQAWRKWIQETVDLALSYHHGSNNMADKSEESWNAFRRKIATESLQWRQYSLFSRQLILRLTLRYKDKKIVSPTRATVKNKVYMDCQNEMSQIIDMFNRWTHWLSVVVNETDSIQLSMPMPSSSTSELPQHDVRWSYFKNKVEEYAEDWKNYNTHLIKFNWEHQIVGLIPEWLTLWKSGGPVWVVSACGAVPSGAVLAGAAGEPTWVARTTHRGRVLPAALRPSRHSCVLYAQGAVHHYTKYQVLCNADVEWIPWCAGAAPEHAVRVAPGVLAGRVRYRGTHLLGAVPAPAYRCHVVILGRPFAVNTYELLVLASKP